MPKRKGCDSTECLLKKIKKLEKKIKQKFKESTASPERESPSPTAPVPENEEITVPDSISPDLHLRVPEPEQDVENEPSVDEAPTEGIETLDESILKVLGSYNEKPQEWGSNIHQQVAERWENIIINGLEKTDKQDILKQTPYLPPQNCPHLQVPKLNLEAAAACSDLNKKKDGYIETRQKMISAAMAGLASAMNCTINEVQPKEIKLNLLELLNNSAKLLADVFHNENKSRRTLVLSGVEKEIRDALMDTKPDAYLFGKDLHEKIKSIRSMNKTGREIRIHAKAAPKPKKNTQATNWTGPPRQTRTQEPRVTKPRSSGPRMAPKRAPPTSSKGYRKPNYPASQRN